MLKQLIFNNIFNRICLLIATILSAETLSAQELNCTVEINSDKVPGSNKSMFETLQSAINDYFNTTTFTNAKFSPNEKIECRFFLTINEVNDNTYTGDIQVQSIRPVYNSSYTTTLLNFKDSKVEFTYQEGEPLIFSENSMESQLTAILNFYAYLFLAIDFDSFSPRGGQPFFDRLAQIVQMAQSSGETGWRQFEDTKNRSAVLSAFTDQSTSGLRDMLYEYHRKGLDEMSVSPDKGRAGITNSLDYLTKMYQVNPMSVGLSMFKDAKMDELVNIYSKAPQTERDRVYNLLKDIFPTEMERINNIKNPPANR